MGSTLVRRTITRGTFHALVGLAFGLPLLYYPRWGVSIALGSVTIILLVFEAVRLYVPSLNQRFLRWFAPLLRRTETSTLTGSSYFMIGCMIVVLAFPRHIAFPAILFLALGDPAAALVGIWKGHIWIRSKSVEGHMACLMICLFAGGLLAATLEDLSLTVVFIGAVAATILQALPLPLNDNITMPLGSALAMTAAGIFW